MAQPKPVFARIENLGEVEEKGKAAEKTTKTKRKVTRVQEIAEA